MFTGEVDYKTFGTIVMTTIRGELKLSYSTGYKSKKQFSYCSLYSTSDNASF